MRLILFIVVLIILRALEVWRFAELSWWYIIGLMVLAFIWFEYIEKMLGLDKKKEHAEHDKRRAERARKTLDKRR